MTKTMRNQIAIRRNQMFLKVYPHNIAIHYDEKKL